MLKEKDFIALGVDEETAKKVAKAVSDAMSSYVPKTDYDVVVKERDTAKATITERDKQISELKKAGDVDDLKKKIETLQEENKQKDKDHAAEIKDLKVNNAIESTLLANGARNMKAVRALLDIDMEKITVKEDGTLEGFNIDEQINQLKKAEDSKFMFKETNTKIQGANPINHDPDDPDSRVDLKNMTYEQIAQYLDENPDAKLD